MYKELGPYNGINEVDMKLRSHIYLALLGMFFSVGAFAGVDSSGGPPDEKRDLILNCEADMADGTSYQLLIGPPQGKALDDSSAAYPVKMYRYRAKNCERVRGFSSSKMRVLISEKISMSFEAPREEVIPEFSASGWELFIPVEQRQTSGSNKDRFESHMQFQIGTGPLPGGNIPFVCATTPTRSKDLARFCNK